MAIASALSQGVELMKRAALLAVCAALVAAPSVRAYVEVPYALGRICQESTNIVVVQVAKVNKEKGLIIFKKVEDLKGKHPQDEIKHNIGQRGFHAREWQNVMAWAEAGKKAVFFHNGGASETCTGTYWYQCYPESEWWGMSHAEPFMLRSYCGDADKLVAAIKQMLAGKEVVVPCMVDGNKDNLHLRKAKIQRLKASLKLQDYDAKRDFVSWGGDGDEVPAEVKTYRLIAESTAGWKFLPQAEVKGDTWRNPDFDDSKWRTGKAPIGYGEDEIAKRKGTTVSEKGVSFVFRRAFDVPSDLLAQKGVTFRVRVASDDHADVYLNGTLVDHDPVDDHEFAYWNRDVEIPVKHVKSGRNVVAVFVKNHVGSSDIYLDMEIAADVPQLKKPVATVKPGPGTKAPTGPVKPILPEKPNQLVVIDAKKKTVTVTCAIAPRKLPNLNEIYPIEVIACYPAPQGQKAHETVVVFKDVKPSDIHRALELLGLKAGKPARGEDQKAEGPEVKLYLEFTGADGKTKRVDMAKTMVYRDSGKPIPDLKWHFTGSIVKQPDPEKDDQVYAADLTGTLIALFPVTDETVIQSHLTMKDEPVFKLETDKKLLPKEGAAAKLIIEVK
jgi:hypothetical protein